MRKNREGRERDWNRLERKEKKTIRFHNQCHPVNYCEVGIAEICVTIKF
jgi:hypothetical protein